MGIKLTEQLAQSAKFYNLLVDEKSKFIYECRLMYAFTKNYQYIKNMINQLPEKKTVDELITFSKQYSDKLIIYGAGNEFNHHYIENNGLEFKLICDRNTQLQKNGWKGHDVISPEELLESYSDHYVAIFVSSYSSEIYNFLINSGFTNDRIINVGAIGYELYLSQYFDKNIVTVKEDEVFIDGGCYDGNTTLTFNHLCSSKYKKIIAFEPDLRNYNRCTVRQEIKALQNVEFVNKGLWNKNSIVQFITNRNQGSKVVEGSISHNNDLEEIITTSIDEYLMGEEVTFIKLDVEGAELKALEGARDTIQKYHPKLSISLYHKPEDIIDIPEYILSLSEDYKFYLRHYQMSACETILYAI